MYMHTFGGMGLAQKNIYRKINDSKYFCGSASSQYSFY